MAHSSKKFLGPLEFELSDPHCISKCVMFSSAGGQLQMLTREGCFHKSNSTVVNANF